MTKFSEGHRKTCVEALGELGGGCVTVHQLPVFRPSVANSAEAPVPECTSGVTASAVWSGGHFVCTRPSSLKEAVLQQVPGLLVGLHFE